MHTIEERFWDKVALSGRGGCWEWAGWTNLRGYGQMAISGHIVLAHRLSFEMCNGRIPSGLCVLHKCDNPPCVNPEHLFLGTRADNVADKKAKGRCSRLGRRKLRPEDVFAVRSLLESGLTLEKIASIFGVQKACIHKIKAGKTWGHLI